MGGGVESIASFFPLFLFLALASWATPPFVLPGEGRKALGGLECQPFVKMFCASSFVCCRISVTVIILISSDRTIPPC